MTNVGETAAPPFDVRLVADLLRQLDKTLRARQLYPADNPTYLKTLDALRHAFDAVWKETGSLTLEVTDTDLKWSGAPVLAAPEKASDSLPWNLYKDGVREVTLAAGFERDEVLELLDIIPRVRREQDDEDDLLTLLWEAEFVFFAYRYLDTVTGEGIPLDLSATPGQLPAAPGVLRDDPRTAMARAKEQAAAAERLEKMLARPAPAATDERVRAAEYLTQEISAEYSADLRRATLDVLLDIFELQEAAAVRTEALQHLDGLLLHLLTASDITSIAHLIRESRVALDRGANVTTEQRQRVDRMLDRISDPAVLAPLLESLDTGATPPPQVEFEAFVDRLRPRALGTLFRLSDSARRPSVRALLAAAADRLATSAPDELVKLIGSAEPAEALEAAKRAGTARIEAAVPALTRLLGRPEEPLRTAAVAALVEIDSPRAMGALERALNDEHRANRMAAIKALTARAHRGALAKVTELVHARELRDMDQNERIAVFELYGTLCGEGGIAWLESQLIGSVGFFKRKSDPETRAAAAAALGCIGTAAARAVLQKATDIKDASIERAVRRALARPVK